MNVLYITADQFRHSAMGCAGHPLVQTPNLDRLVSQAAAAGPACTDSQANSCASPTASSDCAALPVFRTTAMAGCPQAREGVRFGQHFNQALYCGGSRACVHTGTYMMNSRGVTNGVGVDERWTTWPLELRKLGYDPILVGYGDFGRDWRTLPELDPLLQDSDGGPVPGMTREPHHPICQRLDRDRLAGCLCAMSTDMR
jgi:arylsulfatase A-like enzyme